MGARRKIGSGWGVAWLAALAILVQTLTPAAAMAHDARAATKTLVICTADGAVTIAAPGQKDGTRKGFAGLACANCVAASLATLATPDPVALPVRYAARIQARPTLSLGGRALARAPLRPPSQGPPAALNT